MACTDCCSTNTHQSPKYRKALWIVLAINLTMFFVEVIMGVKAGSASLLSDSLDFLGDSANYIISLVVLPMALIYRAKASLVKGYTMGGVGIFILATTLYRFFYGSLPSHSEMGIVGFLALVANMSALLILYNFRDGDSNMRSVWVCSRNDAIGNVAVVVASFAVYFTETKYPDLAVAFVLASLSLQASVEIVKRGNAELFMIKLKEKAN